MKKGIILGTVLLLLSATIILYIACDLGAGRSANYVGKWQYQEGGLREVIVLTQNSFELMIWDFEDPDWLPLFGYKGPMTVIDDSMVISMTYVTAPYLLAPYYYYPNWYQCSTLTYGSNPFLYYFYYFYSYYSYYYGGAINFTYSVSADGNTLSLTSDSYYGSQTITFTRVS